MSVTAPSDQLQLHLTLSYKFSPGEHPQVRSLLDQGYRITHYQRVTDREILVTLTRD